MMTIFINTIICVIIWGFYTQQDCKPKIYLASIDWTIVFKSPLPAQGLWFKNGHPLISNVHRIEINDSSFYPKLNEKIQQLSNSKEIWGFFDARISCIIDNGIEGKDTLTIHTHCLQLNSKYYEFDRSFIKLFYPYLESKQQEILSEYFGF